MKNLKKGGSLRKLGKYLGQDGLEYIAKQAEGHKGPVSAMKYNREGIYNTTIANAFFSYCGEQATEGIPAIEKYPYLYVLCKNFLRNNQTTISIRECADTFTYDEHMNVRHKEIISILEKYIHGMLENSISKEQIDIICKKIKLQYAIQETLKKVICSMDENLGNTSLIVTNNEDGAIGLDISPAYDLDLSFNLGKEILSLDKNGITGNIFYRTTKDGSITLERIVEEFAAEVPGYMERLNEILEKFNGDYTNQIFEIAYQKTAIPDFRKNSLNQEYRIFLMDRIAKIKAILKDIKQKSEKQINK